MNIFNLNGEVFDLDQVISKELETKCVRLTFRNGDQLPLHWRDEQERSAILQTIGIVPGVVPVVPSGLGESSSPSPLETEHRSEAVSERA